MLNSERRISYRNIMANNNDDENIKGKAVVLVTGANRGIGRAVVDAFVQHGARKVYAAVRTVETADTLAEEHGWSLDQQQQSS